MSSLCCHWSVMVRPTRRSKTNWEELGAVWELYRNWSDWSTLLQTPSTSPRENISSAFILTFVLTWIKPSQRSIRSITAHQDVDDMMFKVIIKFVKSRSALSLSWLLGGLIVILIIRINSNWRFWDWLKYKCWILAMFEFQQSKWVVCILCRQSNAGLSLADITITEQYVNWCQTFKLWFLTTSSQ